MSEKRLQVAVCDYLKIQYPRIIFSCDLSSGMKLSIGQAVQAQRMRSSRGLPDIMIFYPNHGYHGLFIELKTTSPFLKDGITLKSDVHLTEQKAILDQLTALNYRAKFGVGFDHCKEIIDLYLLKEL